MLKKLTAIAVFGAIALVTASCGADLKKVKIEVSAGMVDMIEIANTSVAKIESAPSAEDAALASENAAAELKKAGDTLMVLVNSYQLSVQQDDELEKMLEAEMTELIAVMEKLSGTIAVSAEKYAGDEGVLNRMNTALSVLSTVLQ